MNCKIPTPMTIDHINFLLKILDSCLNLLPVTVCYSPDSSLPRGSLSVIATDAKATFATASVSTIFWLKYSRQAMSKNPNFGGLAAAPSLVTLPEVHLRGLAIPAIINQSSSGHWTPRAASIRSSSRPRLW